MKIFKKVLIALLAAISFGFTGFAEDYGLPANIQDGNILHCFDWPAKEVKNALPQIAAAGFGSVQISPLQRGDVKASGSPWHDLYRPYDLAFKSSSFCTEQDLKDLCDAAAGYGIKIIVDVVANHVDKTAGYHDTWWDSNGRVRWQGGINYGDRNSITHGQLGDYGDINSEDSEVIARAKAYVEKLKSLGVKGCRWDAAKHIGLPSEGCNFWSSIASVSGMWHYGEILDYPGPNPSIIKEYAKYMSVTDNKYSNGAAKENGGLYRGYGGDWVVNQGLESSKLVYWPESHDTYSNDEWSQNVDQSVIDRAYACIACRNGATALYLSRPNAKGFGNIKTGKGSTAFTSKHIAAVNTFRNKAGSQADYCEAGDNWFSVTRKDFGAVIVMKGSGNVTAKNGGGYCPAGTYTDAVSGNTFTVTASTISGNVGSSGIAVLFKGSFEFGGGGGDDPIITPGNGDFWILGNLSGAAGWSSTPGTGCAMTASNGKYVASNVKFECAAGETKCYFNITDYVGSTWDDLNMNANRYGAASEGAPLNVGSSATVVKYAKDVSASGCLSWTIPAGTYDITFDPSALTISVANAGGGGGDDPIVNPGALTIAGDYNLAYSGSKANVYYWGGDSKPEWPGVAMQSATGSDGKTYKVIKLPAGTTNIIFNSNGDSDKTDDLAYKAGFVHDDNGPTSTAVTFGNGGGGETTDGVSVYVDGWTNVKCYIYDNGGENAAWPGASMSKDSSTGYWKYDVPDAFKNGSVIISATEGRYPADMEPGMPLEGKSKIFHVANNGWENYSGGNFGGGDDTKPVVSASPAGGTFTESVTVTLTVTPAADIYYTTDGSNPSASSSKYVSPLTFTETTTLKTFVSNENGSNVQSFTYTKSSGPVVITGKTLNTDYYKVNPNGQVGTNRTVNAKFTKLNNDNRMCVADNAMSNWTDADLICQGVARDVAGAIKGKHEYPVIDSYAIYAAYDADNLYLGVQYVYETWDLYGDGKITNGAAKPYNMDGRLMLAFDLDPNKSFEGVLTDGNTIWDGDGQFNTFDNGTDCIFLGSTKSTVGQPALFFPNAQGKASYTDPGCCVSLDAPFYGCQDGLLPSITHIWGQKDFEYDPSVLTSNDNFVDLINEVPRDCHTFYEYKFPLSKLGITESHIKNTGIGVMVIDTYGQGAIGSTPYDPTVFDNAKTPYSKDESSSAEKEDKDVFTYAHARIGKAALDNIDINNFVEEAVESEPEYYNLQGLRVMNPSNGIYIVRRGNKVSKVYVK